MKVWFQSFLPWSEAGFRWSSPSTWMEFRRGACHTKEFQETKLRQFWISCYYSVFCEWYSGARLAFVRQVEHSSWYCTERDSICLWTTLAGRIRECLRSHGRRILSTAFRSRSRLVWFRRCRGREWRSHPWCRGGRRPSSGCEKQRQQSEV